jgi:hypothetical protein
VTDRPGGGATQQLLDLVPAGVDHPSWLPPVLAILFDGCGGGSGVASGGGSGTSAATGWLRRIGSQLHASGGAVPFAVVHDWQARTVVPMMLATVEPAGSAEPCEASDSMATLQRLHARAVAGEPAECSVWLEALEPALHGLYRLAYDYAGSYASAHASATAYATANNFSPDGAVSFAESYAAHSADANRQSFAEANAPVTAAALAAAYARQDDRAYAEAYPFALVRACAHAVAASGVTAEQAGDPDQLRRRRQAAYQRLADGLADSLARLG